jgi:hypothetical protein
MKKMPLVILVCASLLSMMETSCSLFSSKPAITNILLSDSAAIAKVPTLMPCACRDVSSVDLSDSMPPPQQQGTYNDCVGWALAYACRSYYHKQNNHLDYKNGDQLDSANLVSPYFIYNCLRTDPTIGINLLKAIQFLKDSGSCTWDVSDSLTLYTRPTESQRKAALASALNIYTYFRLGYNTGITKDDVRNALKCGNPIIVAVKEDIGYFNKANNDSLSYLWDTVSSISGSHAVVIVGYDDAKESFKFMNSWGVGWGRHGFGEICYNIFDSVIQEAYVLKPNAPLYKLTKLPIVVKNGMNVSKTILKPSQESISIPLDSLVAQDMRLRIDSLGRTGIRLSIPIDSTVLIQVLAISKKGPPLNVYVCLFTLDSNGKAQPMMSKDTANSLGNGQTAFKVIRTKAGLLYVNIPYQKLNIPNLNGLRTAKGYKPAITPLRAVPILYMGQEPVAAGKPIDLKIKY